MHLVQTITHHITLLAFAHVGVYYDCKQVILQPACANVCSPMHAHVHLSNSPVTVCLAVVCSLLVCLKLRESKLKEEWTSSRQSRQQEHRDHTWSTPV